ncbi:hypothetical protein P9J82_04100 [Glaesserella parasuis]|uniref:hypothetical protein n=1 Tax=Glaesserella parasuis TaxID=738 RepID=UPI00094FB67F|nr:hypothetical protein [Glaesserella parasuis]MCT8552816.1 hypothetical protein [Glaesserella parasuis]MCT8757062.1 hypothetical protein [Glaesserella parasuis]MDG4923135.1 hypothetical protein [Glaesserella parasuis]MDG6227069.1 hypothetical protein [Glaesserella parasuis]MDG6233108.1 hypothetical protein [Glaesserella parasuis]
MNNPYQLTGYTTNGKRTLLGTFDKHGQAVAEMQSRKADPMNVYIEFRIAKVYQYQINCFNDKGELVKCGIYQAKAQADLAYQTLKAQYKAVEMVHIGGLSDE